MSANTPTPPPPSVNVPPPSPHPSVVPPSPYAYAGHQAPPPPPHYPPPYGYQRPPARSGGCGKAALVGLFIFFIMTVLGVCTIGGAFLLINLATTTFDELAIDIQEKTITEKVIGGNTKAENKIVIMSIEGVITSNADGFVARQIRRVTADPAVKAIVLRVDSPGGTMSGSDYYLHLLKKMKTERKVPIVVSMGAVAASGGYYVSMVGDEIYAEPSTITGSIGVIASLFDASELFKKVGVESTPITSGEHKAMGSFMKPMSEEERTLWQNLIDENFDRFKEIILEGRKEFLNKETLDKLATGQVYTAQEARRHKLIDNIGFLDDAVAQAGRLANMTERDYKIVQYRAKLSLLDSLLESRTPNKWLSGKALTELSTPKVYLICPLVIPMEGME